MLQVEVADTPAAREIGLMFRSSLETNSGMLFVFEKPQEIRMWMKNTYIPLDMIFIGLDGRISRIEHDTEPFSLQEISSGSLTRWVLEVNAGTARRLGLKPGDLVEHRLITPKTQGRSP